MLKKEIILGIGITSEKKENILKYVINRLHEGGKKLFIVTPNPEILIYTQNHLDYKDKLNEAEIALADGVGVTIAARIMAKPIPERFTGVDFIEALCKACREKPLSMGFLGGRGSVAERTAECLKATYPWITVSFASEELPAGLKDLNQKIDILFVAYGFPKQEEWIYENLEKLPVKAAMGVGGAFDYISGSVPRAPQFMRNIGLEWLFRLLIQPWRLKRQLALVSFIRLVIAQGTTNR